LKGARRQNRRAPTNFSVEKFRKPAEKPSAFLVA
jgi:hypothetical protein